eukprot:Platyproteum_vivax@DN2635_c0_g1_i1.p1
MQRASTTSDLFAPFLLKMPKMRKAFKKLYALFNEHSGGKKDATPEQLRQMLHHVGLKEISDEEFKSIIETSDLNQDRTMSFKEFVISAGVFYFLKKDVPTSIQTDDYKQIKETFELVEKMFKKIDKDDSGQITAEELKSALSNFSDDKDIADARLKEMDISGDKEVDFPEFLYGFCMWAGWDEDEN